MCMIVLSAAENMRDYQTMGEKEWILTMHWHTNNIHNLLEQWQDYTTQLQKLHKNYTIRFDQNILPRYLLPCYRVSSLMHKGGLPQIGYLMFQTLWGLNIFLKKLRNIPLKTAGTWHFVPDILSEMASNISLQKHAQCMES